MQGSLERKVAIVSGVRTPFIKSHQDFAELSSYELGRAAVAGLLARTGIDPRQVGMVCFGTVIHEPRTPNVAREIVLGSRLPPSVPAATVSLACISSNFATTTLVEQILRGQTDIAIAGGTDTCSDPPIRFSRPLRKLFVRLSKAKGSGGYLREMAKLARLSPRDFAPDTPAVQEFSSGKSMGQGAELLAQMGQVSREEADRFAVRSHKNAALATDNGFYEEDLVPVDVPPHFGRVSADNGIRGDSTIEGMAKLRPAFDRQFGVCTAGNSSFLTDGASAMLLMEAATARAQGLAPLALVRDYIYAAGDAWQEMLLGPALTIPHLLARNGIGYEDVGVWEIHEAFACQVVANLRHIADPQFVAQRLGIDPKWAGQIPRDQLNIHGGSLSLGHPFGATGTRLLWTAARRLQIEQQRYAVVAGCAAGGHGNAILLTHADL